MFHNSFVAASEFDPTDFNKRCLDPTDNVISPSGNERFIVVYKESSSHECELAFTMLVIAALGFISP